jgi:predicted GNAT superfamily acetyltransferase
MAGAALEMTVTNFNVRPCTTLTEFDRCVELERVTWQESIIVPTALFVVAIETGGQVLGAFAGSDGSEMIGFLMALVGANEGQVFLHSHMTAVLPAWQNRGVGRALKLAQRDEALRRGIRLIEWTFDPLELRNAHFNFRRLGAVARRYIPNLYGITDSPLHVGLPTDRLLAEWHLDSPHVVSTVADHPAQYSPARSETRVRINVPGNIGELRANDRAAALVEQCRIRAEFEHWFALGYTAVDLHGEATAASYILAPCASSQH